MARLFLTPQEVAELSGLHPRTIRRWCALGKLPSGKVGQKILIPIKEAAKLLGVSQEEIRSALKGDE